jgi:uncharacterized protein YbaR (Trm112 family)
MAETTLLLERHLHLLACPVCHGGLRLEAAAVVCAGCGRRYPVVEGLPVLIESRAQMP